MSEFNDLLEQLTDEEFWEWVSGWYDEQHILDTINDWEDNLKKEAIKEFKEIIAQREHIKEEISVPIYFRQDGKKIIIDEESIFDEFNDKLKEVIKNPKKFLEV
jgi:hypothetical protein